MLFRKSRLSSKSRKSSSPLSRSASVLLLLLTSLTVAGCAASVTQVSPNAVVDRRAQLPDLSGDAEKARECAKKPLPDSPVKLTLPAAKLLLAKDKIVDAAKSGCLNNDAEVFDATAAKYGKPPE